MKRGVLACLAPCVALACSHVGTAPDVDTYPPCEDPWGWLDEATGLCWHTPPDDAGPGDQANMWEGAVERCDGLSAGDHIDWRLPTISELRSLVRGCPDTMTGGACPVTDDCLEFDTCWENLCNSDCDAGAGPGLDGCFWDVALGGCQGDVQYLCGREFWSSSVIPPSQEAAYFLDFFTGTLNSNFKNTSLQARCVRDVDQTPPEGAK